MLSLSLALSLSPHYDAHPCSLRTDRTSSSRRWSFGETSVLLCLVEEGLSQHFRWSSVVFDLLSTSIESIHSCATLHLVFCSSLHFDALEHHVLRSRSTSEERENNRIRWNLHWSSSHHSTTGLLFCQQERRQPFESVVLLDRHWCDV